MKEIYLYKKSNTSHRTINVGLSYPSTYFYGMSVLGFLSLFKEFDINEKVNAQRIFLNSKNLGFEPKALDLLGFSCVFEYDILQILKILKKYNFKLESSKRKRKMPLIFAGGPVISSNPEPFADFFDFMTIGDGEGLADEIIEVYSKNKHKTKTEILIELAKIPGVYVPSLYQMTYSKDKLKSCVPHEKAPIVINKRVSKSEKCLYSPIISDKTFYSDTVFIELARGCACECKFCTARWQNLPTRFYDLKYIKKAIKKASKYAKKIVFIGAMISSHPDFDEICRYLIKMKSKREFDVEFSSMGFEHKSQYVPELIEEKTISLAIECGSEKLRFKSGKNISDEKIYETIDFYLKKGISKINLYFIIGLPEETEEDIDKYIKFAIGLKEMYQKVQFYHIISSFNPKPHTPYARAKRQSNAVLEEYIIKIKDSFSDNQIEASYPLLHNDNFNALISLGDRRLGKYILHVFEKNIPLNKALIEYKKFMKKYNAKVDTSEKLSHYVNYIYKQKDEKQYLPWNLIRMPIE